MGCETGISCCYSKKLGLKTGIYAKMVGTLFKHLENFYYWMIFFMQAIFGLDVYCGNPDASQTGAMTTTPGKTLLLGLPSLSLWIKRVDMASYSRMESRGWWIKGQSERSRMRFVNVLPQDIKNRILRPPQRMQNNPEKTCKSGSVRAATSLFGNGVYNKDKCRGEAFPTGKHATVFAILQIVTREEVKNRHE